jgi:hypothetical protein
MCWASFGVSPSAAGQGATRRGSLGCSALRHDSARAAMAARRAFGPSLPPSLVDKAEFGAVPHGGLRQGEQRLGLAGSSKGHRRWHGGSGLPATLTRVDSARRGMEGLGGASHGEAWHGAARQGLQTAARSFYGGSLLLSLEGRLAEAWRCKAWRGGARLGVASCGQARADDLSTEGASPP